MKTEDKDLNYFMLDWLLVHHGAMLEERKQIVKELDIYKNDIVLDVASGPGLWSNLLANKTGLNGQIHCFDNDEELIEYGKNHNKGKYKDIVSFSHADYSQIPFDNNKFDCAFCGGSFHFAKDYVNTLSEVIRVVKSGGRIFDKSFDGSALFFNPLPPTLQQSILLGVAKNIDSIPHVLDNYLGLKTNGYFKKAGLVDVKTKVYALHKCFPLSKVEQKYILTNADWYLENAKPWISDDEIAAWENYFNPNSVDFILEKENFFFYMVQVVTTGTVIK